MNDLKTEKKIIKKSAKLRRILTILINYSIYFEFDFLSDKSTGNMEFNKLVFLVIFLIGEFL
jgi:hypothetical protein